MSILSIKKTLYPKTIILELNIRMMPT